jgi:hypothetical protein
VYESTIYTDSGYKDAPQEQRTIFQFWVFDDEDLWIQAAQYYFEDASDMSSPTNTQSYNKGPAKLVFLESSGKVRPKVEVALTFTPRG